MSKFPTILALVLYILIYFLRLEQTGLSFLGNSFKTANSSQGVEIELFSSFRKNLDETISKFLPSPQAELLSGILLGNKKNLPAGLNLALRDSSTLHIVVVSGQNLTLLAGLITMLLAGVCKRSTALLISFLAIIFYTLLTGAQIPVIRAAIMATLGFSASFLGRMKEGVWVLVATGGVMLLISPALLTNISFQLSFLATLGVIVVAPVIDGRLKFLPGFISGDIAITTAAQLLVLPVIAQNFHQLSLVGVLANLMVGWTIPFIMGLGTLMIVLGSLVSFFGQTIALAANSLLTYFIYVVSFFASLPFAWEYVGEKIWLFWLGYYFLLAGGLLAINKIKK